MGHWYSKDGVLMHRVEGAKGQQVEPDLRHARKLNLAPGVTSIIKMAASEALVQYRERQVLMAALTLPRDVGESDEAYCARVMRDSKVHAEKAAQHGTDIHSTIEHNINDLRCQDAWVVAARQALEQACGQQVWSCERGVVSEWGFATKSDLSTMGKGDAWVVDVKTKDGPLDEVKTYDEHAMQLAATRQALGWDVGSMPAQAGILFVRRDQPEARFVVVEQDQLGRGWRLFSALLEFWQVKNRYAPEWAWPSSSTWNTGGKL
jgi:hypothetical protein